jgi:2,3-bisphosphoglycerate-dependent phosphoglycerate mutase
MYRKFNLFFFILMITAACVDSTSRQENNQTHDYRFILMRHAEKEAGEDPGLTTEGALRANRLAQLLTQESISAIYSTDYKRTQATVTPLSDASTVAIESYMPMDPQFLPTIFSKYPKGGLFVIAGHSNTIPRLVNQLVGDDRFEELDESDYNDFFIVSCTELGTGSVIHLTY